MSRWHESGCKQPAIVVLDDVPCCTHCFAFATTTPNVGNIVPASLWSDALPEGKRSGGNLSRPRSRAVQAVSARTSTFEINYKEQIRLLKLSSRQSCTPIHAYFESTNIRDALLPSYEILSYPRSRGTLDISQWRPMYVGRYWDVIFIPQRYEELLQAVRDEQSDRRIWMECICVDEADLEEKTSQTTLIPQVLRGASKTLVWLGSDFQEDYDTAITFLKTLESTGSSPSPNTPISSRNLKSLKSLLQHDYFTTVQAIREVVLSRNLTMIYRNRTLLWTDEVSQYVIFHAAAPRWLRGPAFRFDTTERDMLWLLLEASSYYSHDDRDKVFALLALFHMGDVVVDYKTSVEKVYVDVAAYLCKSHFLEETLSIASTQEKRLDLPSWVPDWSVPIALKPSPGQDAQDAQEDPELMDTDETWDEATPIEVVSRASLYSDILADSDNGRLIIHDAVRLCALRNAVVQRRYKNKKLSISAGSAGTLVINCPDDYCVSDADDLFLFPSMKSPVVLRYNRVRKSYTQICSCKIGKGPPAYGNQSLIPWDDPTRYAATIQVSDAPQDITDLMSDFYTRLRSLHETVSELPRQRESHNVSLVSSHQAETLILDLTLLSLTGLLEVEAVLRERWMALDRELSWIFIDREAVSSLLREMHTGIHGPTSGHDDLPFDTKDANGYFRSCGINIPLACEWDIFVFCCSHMTQTTFAPSPVSGDDQSESPMLSLLRSKFDSIRMWAVTSAQLLSLFEISGSALSDSWPDFPGTSVFQRWHSIDWSHAGHYRSELLQRNCWNWSDFRSVLQSRAEIWRQPVPDRLALTGNKSLAVRLSLRCLGLNLTHKEDIEME